MFEWFRPGANIRGWAVLPIGPIRRRRARSRTASYFDLKKSMQARTPPGMTDI
jgi:hypothetical protein